MNVILLLVLSAAPVAKIEGPESARIGDLVVVASAGEAHSYKWAVLPKGTQGWREIDGGRRLVFSSHEPRTYTFVLAIGSSDGAVDVSTHEVVLGEAHLPLVSRAKSSTVQAMTPRPPSWTRLVQGAGTEEAGKLAGAFRMAASMIDTEHVGDAAELFAATGELSRGAVGDRIEAWQPWLDAVDEWVEGLEESGDLDTIAEYAERWRELAKTLGAKR